MGVEWDEKDGSCPTCGSRDVVDIGKGPNWLYGCGQCGARLTVAEVVWVNRDRPLADDDERTIDDATGDQRGA